MARQKKNVLYKRAGLKQYRINIIDIQYTYA